ncbi:MAG: HD domain-containing protein [Sulfurimonas sp.]|nr:HD domain-containing protein [Sulfurimonas sp.]
MIFLSLISTITIYFFQQYFFTISLANEIKINVDKKVHKYEQKLRLLPQDVIEKDVKSFMKDLDFIQVELYDENENQFYILMSSNKKFENKLELINSHDELSLHNFPTSNKMSYNFFEAPQNNYFIQIFYPIYKSNELLGYIEGILYIDPIVIQRFKRAIVAINITVVLSILLFSLLIFPLIYFAYKKLNNLRSVLLSSNIMMINTLGNTIALRDSDTNEHNYRVTLYAIKLAQKIELDKKDMQKLIKGAFLHDIGKIGISDNILLKKDKLNKDEINTMKKHVLKGVALVKENSWLKDSIDVILNHHEKFDGSGYPCKVKGLNIPKIARIFSIIDVFDALTSKRPYKEAFSYEESITIIKNKRGSHFDPDLVNIFLQISKELYDTTNSRSKKQLKEELDELIEKYFFD